MRSSFSALGKTDAPRGARGLARAKSLTGLAVLLSAACAVSCSGEMGSPTGSAADTGAPGTAANTPTTTNPALAPPADVPEPNDWFSAVQSADCSGPTTLSRTRIRRLSNTQWSNTVQAALGATVDPSTLPPDALSSNIGFNTDAEVNKVNVLLANAYFDQSAALAPAAATAAITQYSCLSTAAGDPSCSSAFINDYGGRLFRRPLTADETARYAAFLTEQAALDTPDVAVGTVIQAMMMSPDMIFITELGSSAPGQVTLTPYEQASLISYMIADIPPDQALLDAAAAGQLSTPEQRATHVARLLGTPQARTKYADFWQQYLPTGDLRQATDMDPNVVAAMGAEPQQQFDKVVWDQGGNFLELLTANYTYGDPALAQVYGTMTPDSTGRSTLPVGERSGFLTEPAVLFSSPDSSEAHKIIHRGLNVMNRLLCQPLTPPPPDLKPNPADLQPLGADATPLESFEAFKEQKPACAACHVGFQPYGLSFESYDDQGHFRQTYDNGKPVLTAGELTNAGDASGPYADVVELGTKIGNSQIGQDCFARQYAEYALGRHLNASVDACTIQELGAAAPTAIKQLPAVLSELEAGSDRFHTPVQ